MKKITENSTKRVGEFLTLKEARKGLLEKYAYHKERSRWFFPCPIYQEHDGTYSIERPKIIANASFIEAVDGKSGRRFIRVKKYGEWFYIPKKKIQDGQTYSSYSIIFP